MNRVRIVSNGSSENRIELQRLDDHTGHLLETTDITPWVSAVVWQHGAHGVATASVQLAHVSVEVLGQLKALLVDPSQVETDAMPGQDTEG